MENKSLDGLIHNLQIEEYDILDDEEKEELNRYMSDNIVLKTLVNNHINLKNYQLPIKYILGPKNITKFTKKEKTIYLIGEGHFPFEEVSDYKLNEIETIRMSDFLMHLFTYSPVPLDFYLEGSDEIAHNPNDKKDLHRLRIYTHKNESYPLNFPTTRFHTIDIRLYDDNCIFNLDSEFFNRYALSKRQLHQLYNIKPDCKLLQRIKKQIINCNDDCIKIYLEKMILLYESFENAQTDSFIKEFNNYVFFDLIKFPSYFKVDYNISPLKNIIECLKKLFKNSTSENMIFQSTMKEFFMRFENIFMEAYTLGRMFRSYKQVDKIISIEPRNMIFYGGDMHRRNITKILDMCGFAKHVLHSKLVNPEKIYPYITYMNDDFFGMIKLK